MNQSLRRCLLVFLALVVVVSTAGGGLVGVAFAQAENESGNETNTTNDSAGNETTSGDSGGPSGPGLNPGTGSSGGGPGDAVGDVARAPAQAAANAALGPVFEFVVGIPTIDIGLFDADPIHQPTNWPASELFAPLWFGLAFPITTIVFTLLLLISLTKLPLSALVPTLISTYSASSQIVRALLAIATIPMHLMFFSMERELFSRFVEQVAPTPAEIITNMGLLEFTLATVFTGMGLAELGWDMIKWMGIIYAFLWLYITFYPMISLPFIAAAVYNPRSFIGKFSAYTFILDFSFLMSKATAAVLLYFSMWLDWGVHLEGIINAFVSLALIAGVLATPVVTVILMILSKNRVMSAIMAGGGAAAGSTIAAKARESEYLQEKKEKAAQYKEQKKEQGKDYGKRGAAKAQGKYWDVKNRSKALAATATRSPSLAASAGKERLEHWRSSSDSGSNSGADYSADGGVTVTNAERMRNMEQMNDQAGGLSASQRKRYFNMKMEQNGAFDSGLGSKDSADTNTKRGDSGGS